MPHDPLPDSVADALLGNWVDRYAPLWLKPYARLARWDRPIGFWLLFWPCAWGLALAAVARPETGFGWWHGFLMLVGAVFMRGAGCTFNDLVDRDIDRAVARTRSRPLASGRLTPRQGLIFLIVQVLLGAVILFQFNRLTVWMGVASLVLVAIYPFMKRITWWPQVFLGLAFSYGVPLGWASQIGGLSEAALLFYAGTVLWVIGYDTIYALQDVEDDALVGVKSTARLFGTFVRPMVGLCYVGAVLAWLAGAISAGGGLIIAVSMLVPAGLLAWQVGTLEQNSPGNALIRFRLNHYVGMALTLALLAEWVW